VQGFGAAKSDLKPNTIFLKMATLATSGEHSDHDAEFAF
jgi:hypothetical protein